MAKPDIKKIGKKHCLKLGIDRNTFFVMKRNNPEKLKYIQSLAEDIVSAMIIYRDEKERIKTQIVDDYYKISSVKKITKFAIFLVNKNVISDRRSYHSFINRCCSESGLRSHKAFLKGIKIVELFNEFSEKERLDLI